MRKQNKIVSLVLVLALLLGVIVVVPTSPVVASAADEGTTFTPTATLVKQEVSNSATTSAANTSIKNAALASDPGLITGFYVAKADPFDYYVVTEGDDSYAMVSPVATGTYGTDAQMLFSMSYTLLAATDWYTADFDIASESAFPESFYVQLALRDSTGSGTATFAPSVDINTFVPADGNWHHVTIVGDLAADVRYVYVDGVLKDDTQPATNATVNNVDYSAGLTATGVKFSNTSTKTGNIGDTVYIDNVSHKQITGDAITALSAAVTAGDITSWSGYQAAKGGSLPALASVDGVEYSHVDGVNAALNTPFGATAELLRDFEGTITVNCDATVETHGVSGSVVAGTNVTASASGTVNTYDAEPKSTVTETEITTDGAATTGLVASTTGNLINSIKLTNWDSASIGYFTSTTYDGEVYGKLLANASAPTGNHFLNVGVSSAKTLDFANGYYVVELDYACEDASIEQFSVNTIISWSGSTSSADRPDATPGVYPGKLGINDGKWHHIALVAELSSNTCYVYVDGQLVDTKYKKTDGSGAYGAYNADNYDASRSYWVSGVRYNMGVNATMTAGSTACVDNFSIRTFASSAELTYGTSAAQDRLPVLATVNGEKVNTPAELSAALVGNDAKDVVLYRDYSGTVTVNCDATVETNGFTVPVAGTTEVEVSNDGTLYTFNAPYQSSSSFQQTNDSTAVMNAIKLDIEDNIWNSFTPTYVNGSDDKGLTGATMGLTTNIVDGNIYVDMKPGDAGSNSYLTLSPVQGGGVSVVKGTTNQYYVLDMDLAFYGDVSTSFGWYAVCRGTKGFFGNNINAAGNFNSIINALEKGEFHHFTTVLDFDNNKILLFINGVLVGGCNNGAYGSAGASEYVTGFKFEQFRLFSSNVDNFAVDNVAIRAVSDVDEMASVIAASSLDSWSMNIQGTYDEGKLAPIATVDGEYVYAAATLNDALNGRYAKDVEIISDITDTITVNCSATVETNGLSVNLVAGSDIKESSNAGTVYTYVAKWKASATETAASSGDFIIASDVDGNLFTGRTGINYVNNGNGEMAMYQVTDANTGNTYLKLQPTVDGTTGGNVYLTTEIIPAATAGDTSANCVLIDGEGYYVYDLDIATDANIIANMTIAPSARDNASEQGTFPFPSGVTLSNYSFTDGEWMHMTIVGDMAANIQYVFINGTLAGQAGQANSKAGTCSALNVKGYRMNLSTGAAISKDQTILMDNLSARVYKTNDAAGDIAAAITAGSLAGWSNNVTTENTVLPSIATVDGVEYSSASALTSALAGGKNHVVSLDRATTAAAAAASTATITTNGLANFIKAANGYTVTDNGDGTYTVSVETRMGTITVNINGTAAIKANVLYGTDIAEYLNENNSYVFDVVSADNGQVYTGATWDVAPAGVVDGDEVYNVTATKCSDAYLVLDASGNAVAVDTVDAALNANATYSVILNSDVTLAAQVTIRGNKTVYMAGHVLSFPTSGSSLHALQIASTSNITFVNGYIVDNVRSNTQAIIYAGYGFAGEFALLNCSVYAVGNLVNGRGGTFTFEDCSINMLECQNSYGIALCEYYNAGYTYTKCTLNFINSDVQFNHFTAGRTQAFITTKDYSEWTGTPTDTDKANAVAAGADTLEHEINISGSTFHMSYNAALISNSNTKTTVNIENSQLNVKTLASKNAGTIVIGEGVTSSTSLGSTYLADGVVEVKSNNPAAPYAYTAYYATVVWSDGTSELWADGSYPTNAELDDVVTKVEAGQTYNFAAGSANVSMKANLTLDTDLALNVYIPTTTNLSAINISGVDYAVGEGATVVTISGVEYYQFSYSIAPYYAAGDITIAVTVDGATYARELNLVAYADAVCAAYTDEASLNLVKSVLKYAATAIRHVGSNLENYDTTNGYADAATVTAPTSGVNTMSNVNAYFSGASLDLTSAPMWRLTVVSGANLDGLTIDVGGTAVEYDVVGSYVYIKVAAYDMLDTVTVTVGGVSGQYNLDAYYVAMNELAATLTDPSTTTWQAKANIAGAEAYYYVNGILPAFYEYVTYAAAYKA